MIKAIQQRWYELDKKTYKTIMNEFKISQLTAKKYVYMSEDEICSMDTPTVYRPRKKPTNDYINIIYKMHIAGVRPEMIFSYVCKLGYCGTWCALDHQITNILKNNFGVKLPMKWYLKSEYSQDVTVIRRNEVIKYITTKKEKKTRSEKIAINITLIKTKYPIVANLEEIYNSFYSILMGDDPNKFMNFIEINKNSSMKGFIEGIEKDIAPIKNAISLPYSSGFVEGNNNKFKLIKRILYGRSNLVNLFRKCYVPFLLNNTDIKLIDLFKDKNSTISCAVQ